MRGDVVFASRESALDQLDPPTCSEHVERLDHPAGAVVVRDVYAPVPRLVGADDDAVPPGAEPPDDAQLVAESSRDPDHPGRAHALSLPLRAVASEVLARPAVGVSVRPSRRVRHCSSSVWFVRTK
ncbi:MAG: hypothetical protein IT376_06640 [Polyangiaceae bacterium]|nr:hypothetical protein [Polyangiaceae bacterium]